jgi:hypothetical protein
MNTINQNCDLPASERISQRIIGNKDWRGRKLEELRKLILDAEPDIKEEFKWGTPVWSKNGNICSAILYRNNITLNFFKGASLVDPNGLFNADMEGNVSRAIVIRNGEAFDELDFMELIREAITFNILGEFLRQTNSTRTLPAEDEAVLKG